MKFNKIFFVLLALVLVSSIGIAVAEDASVGPYSFTVPDGYTIANSADDSVSMQLDDNNAITFATGVSDDIDAAKENFLSQGKELIEEDTLDYDGNEVLEKPKTKYQNFVHMCDFLASRKCILVPFDDNNISV